MTIKTGDRVIVAAFEGTVVYINAHDNDSLEISRDGVLRTVDYVAQDLVTVIATPHQVGDTGDRHDLDDLPVGSLIRGTTSGALFMRGREPGLWVSTNGSRRNHMIGEYVIEHIATTEGEF